jgi:hypothetical protein
MKRAKSKAIEKNSFEIPGQPLLHALLQSFRLHSLEKNLLFLTYDLMFPKEEKMMIYGWKNLFLT